MKNMNDIVTDLTLNVQQKKFLNIFWNCHFLTKTDNWFNTDNLTRIIYRVFNSKNVYFDKMINSFSYFFLSFYHIFLKKIKSEER